MMRLSIAAATIFPLVANFQVCGASNDADPHATSAKTNVTATVALPVAKHGGTVVAVGQTSLELVVKADGVVQAYPTEATAGATGVTVIPPTATVTVQVPTIEGRSEPVQLAWAAGGPTPAFEGRVIGHVVRPGPVEVTVSGAAPAPIQARIEASPVVVVPARGGTVVPVGDASMEVVFASNGTVQAYPIFPTVASMEVLPPAASITVDVPVQEGPAKPTTLTWMGPIASFEGHVDGGVIAPGPVSFHCNHGGRVIEARAPTFVVQPPSAVVVAGPQHGGTIVDVEGGHKLEVVVTDEGRVDAYPYVYVGAPPMPTTAEVTVEVPVEVGPPRPVQLSWGVEGSFGGTVTGAVIKPGPVNVVMVNGGVRMRGHAPAFVVVAAPPRPRATVVVRQPPPPPVRTGVMVSGQTPGVRVQATVPSVRVQVQGPSVGIGVRTPGWRSPRRP